MEIRRKNIFVIFGLSAHYGTDKRHEEWIPGSTQMDRDGDIYLNRIYRAYLSENSRNNMIAIIDDMQMLSSVLYAEHEFNASTFAARVTAATLSDFHSCITSAIGTLRGPLHGGANEKAMELIEQFQTPDEAETKLKEMLQNKAKIMGFGHRVYKNCDPRSDIIKSWSKKLGENKNDMQLFDISQRIDQVMSNEKGLFPNLDFYSDQSTL